MRLVLRHTSLTFLFFSKKRRQRDRIMNKCVAQNV